MENGYSYTLNALIALDQLLNALLGGSCDETLSSRASRRAQSSSYWAVFQKIVDTVFYLDVDAAGHKHCELSYMVEMAGGHLPKSMVLAKLKNN